MAMPNQLLQVLSFFPVSRLSLLQAMNTVSSEQSGGIFPGLLQAFFVFRRCLIHLGPTNWEEPSDLPLSGSPQNWATEDLDLHAECRNMPMREHFSVPMSHGFLPPLEDYIITYLFYF